MVLLPIWVDISEMQLSETFKRFKFLSVQMQSGMRAKLLWDKSMSTRLIKESKFEGRLASDLWVLRKCKVCKATNDGNCLLVKNEKLIIYNPLKKTDFNELMIG